MENWTLGDRVPVDMDFTGAPGIRNNVNIPNNPSCADYFSLFVPEEIYEIMSTETNRYANDYLTKNTATIRPNSRYKKWKDTTPEEMKMFVGITIAMGIITQLDTSEYWTTDEVNETPFFRKCMSRDRFWLLLSFFHLADNSKQVRRGQQGHDPVFKLGTV